MKETNVQPNEPMVIDLTRVFRAVVDRTWLVLLISLLSASIAFAVTFFLITPKYQSAATFYVNNSKLSLGDASLSISSGDLTTSRNLVDSYLVILDTRETIMDVIDYASVPYTESQLRDMISANAVNETEFFRITVTSTDPQEAERIASAIAYILPKRIATIIDGTSARVADAAVVAAKPSSPSYTKNTVIGFMLGFMLVVVIVVLREIFDVTVRSEEDVATRFAHPILASVPDMMDHSKGGYYYGGTHKKKKRDKNHNKEMDMVELEMQLVEV